MTGRMDIVHKYFAAQNVSDADGVVELFTPDATVHNAAFPPVSGHDGVRGFCVGLYDRTSRRHFTVTDVAEAKSSVFAEWEVTMTFRRGAKIGPFELANDFDVRLRGVNKFEFGSPSEKISCLRVFHGVVGLAESRAHGTHGLDRLCVAPSPPKQG